MAQIIKLATEESEANERFNGQAYDLGRCIFVIGRKSDYYKIPNSLAIEDKSVSSPHCFLLPFEGGAYLGDFGSTCGTFYGKKYDLKIGKFKDIQIPKIIYSDFFENSFSFSALSPQNREREGRSYLLREILFNKLSEPKFVRKLIHAELVKSLVDNTNFSINSKYKFRFER